MMKYAADFRAIARNALRGKWGTAILTGFVAALIGAEIFTNNGSSGSNGRNNDSFQSIIRDLQHTDLWPLIVTVFVIALIVLVIWVIVSFVIGGAGMLGYAKFNLNLVDGKKAAFSDLFSQFDRLGDGFCMKFLTALYTLLWSLLFLIPGIVKSYSYAMTPYILSEHPEMTANEAITESRRIMPGNRWRLFCLEISFIGWSLLCLLPPLAAIGIGMSLYFTTGNVILLLLSILAMIPLGAGNLLLRPYREAARAAFYREVSGTWETAAPPPNESAYEYRQYTQEF